MRADDDFYVLKILLRRCEVPPGYPGASAHLLYKALGGAQDTKSAGVSFEDAEPAAAEPEGPLGNDTAPVLEEEEPLGADAPPFARKRSCRPGPASSSLSRGRLGGHGSRHGFLCDSLVGLHPTIHLLSISWPCPDVAWGNRLLAPADSNAAAP